MWHYLDYRTVYIWLPSLALAPALALRLSVTQRPEEGFRCVTEKRPKMDY